MHHQLALTTNRLVTVMALGVTVLAAASALAGQTDLSPYPLASSSNQSVPPNVMFILDDSGSMDFDALPDNAENLQGGTERRYFDEMYQCKPKGILTTGVAAKSGLMPTHCDRVDPPFGAAEFNGLYYNPSVRYKPAVDYLGNPMASINPTGALCDPFPTAAPCSGFYQTQDGSSNFGDYYKGLALTAYLPKGPSNNGQTYQNAAVAYWYGTGNSLDLTTKFPEIVYCNSTGASPADNTGTQCRRNGLTASIAAGTGYDTGSPFRYTTAQWRSGYPEAPEVNMFVRPATGSTVTVTTAAPHGWWTGSAARTISANGNYPIFNTYAIVPRTNTGTASPGFDNCSPWATCDTPTTVIPNGPQTFTFSRNSGTKVAYAGLDMQWQFSRRCWKTANSACTANVTADHTVYVTGPSHGLIVGDKINVYAMQNFDNFFTSGSTDAFKEHINCGQGGTQTVLAVPDADHFTYTVPTSGTVPNGMAGSGTYGCAAYNGGTNVTVPGFVQKTGLFNIPKLRASNAFYFTIQPTEYCSDPSLINCTATTTPTGSFTYAAPVRYCANIFDANQLATPSGNDLNFSPAAPRCREKFQELSDPMASGPYPLTGGKRTGYIYPRYGQFVRVDINGGTLPPKAVGRTDCAGTTCTLAQEQQNFANWFGYYRTRMQMMKTSAGLAFMPLDTSYRIGYITINPGNPVTPGSKFLPIKAFDATQKQAWYNQFYNSNPGGGTPLPQALSRVGRYFAHKTTGINQGILDDPIQYYCQQNFAILTTDGYWNFPGGPVDLNGNAIGDVDNAAAVVRPMFDGNLGINSATQTTVGTVADVALYYYMNDLRPTGSIGALGTDVSKDDVPVDTSDTANWQHMVTFGLGMSTGLMHYQADYAATNSIGDFNNVRNGASGSCSWTLGQCNWPVPGSLQPSNLDDLWHAAVNGRGDFFFAKDTASVQTGLYNALTSLKARNAAAAAAATSTPNITPTDHAEFVSIYVSVDWSGELKSLAIDPNDGTVAVTPTWTARDQLESMAAATTDSRRIILRDVTQTGGATKNFTYGNLTAAEKLWFDNLCAGGNWSQCSTLDFGTGTSVAPAVNSAMWLANQGTNLVNFLRGQTSLRGTIYRNRPWALGDTVNSAPLYIGVPKQAFADPVSLPYNTWKAQTGIAGRTPVVYVGANDGMLHAFNANTGVELWAYIPRMVAPNMWKLADINYGTKHAYYVDGSLTTGDVWDGSTWRTVLVGGLNSGGRGYFALDVTDPNAPLALWELCSDTTLALCSVADANIGFSYGNPVITKRASDGKWVVLVTSGYNNVSPGDAHGHLYALDAVTGAIVGQTATPDLGNNTTPIPSGLGRIAVWANNGSVDNTGIAVYGGDLLGNIWKFNLTVSPATVVTLGQAKDLGGKPQPITTKPELALVQDIYKVVYVGTGRYLGNTDLTDPSTQTTPVPNPVTAWMESLYAFKDTSTNLGTLRTAGLVKQTLTTSGTQRTVSSLSVDFTTQPGWYVDFDRTDSPGERVNIDPQLALGTLNVVTNVPNTSACAAGGDSFTYQFNYLTGSYVATAPGGVVGYKQTGALSVGMVIYQLQKGSLIGQLQRSDTKQVLTPIYTAPGSSPHRRTNWRELTR